MQYAPEEIEFLQQQQGALPMQPMPVASKDPELMASLLNMKARTIEPLKHTWAGETEVSPGVWKSKPELAVMNEEGIYWCIGEMDGFLNPTFLMSNFDEEQMNWQMRKLGRLVWNGVCQQYAGWDLSPINIPKVCWGVILKCHAVLLAARGDGTRRFLSTTHQVTEQRNTNIQQQQAQKKGIFGMFKPKPQQEEHGGYGG